MPWIIGICGICLLVCLPMYMRCRSALRYTLAAAYKTAGTLCAASLALIAALKLDPRCWICFIALLLCAAAGLAQEFNGFWGGIGSLSGHICLIAFFTNLFPPATVHLICGLGLSFIMAALLWRWRKEIGKRMPLFALYGLITAVMSACAIGCLTGKTLQGQLIAVGGVLYFLSNVLILGKMLFAAECEVNWAMMITYLGGQLLFGVSCLIR